MLIALDDNTLSNYFDPAGLEPGLKDDSLEPLDANFYLNLA